VKTSDNIPVAHGMTNQYIVKCFLLAAM